MNALIKSKETSDHALDLRKFDTREVKEMRKAATSFM